MAIIREVRLIKADANENNNKYWHADLHDNGDLHVEWGRVGVTKQDKTHHCGSQPAAEKKLNNLVKQKTGPTKGYTEQRTVAAQSRQSSSSIAQSSLKHKAVQDIGGSSEVRKLVSWLAEVNIHKIVANTSITYDPNAGTFSTPLGLVTSDGLVDARVLLNDMAGFVQHGDLEHANFKRLAGDFLRIVPQNVGMGRGWHKTFFGTNDLLNKQFDLLDSLDASLQQALTTPKKKAKTKDEPVFEVKLDIVTDQSVFNRIRSKYRADKGGHRDVATLDVRTIYKVHVPTVANAFEKDGRKVGGIKQLWHGTKASNLLSILKVGLVIPPSSAGHCTGRMFGNGLYFSDQSTKSLRYATNAWTRGGRSDRTFMFLADVAMGKSYIPAGWGTSRLPRGYDSMFAKAGRSGVQNNEIIVYRTSQANLVHLIEFTPHGR